MDDKIKEFMLGLRELTFKTGIKIDGCGCCGSPFLEVLEPKDIHDKAGYCFYGDGNENITWDSDESNDLIILP